MYTQGLLSIRYYGHDLLISVLICAIILFVSAKNLVPVQFSITSSCTLPASLMLQIENLLIQCMRSNKRKNVSSYRTDFPKPMPDVRS